MDWPADGLASFFLVCFFIGLLFSVVSFFLDLGHGGAGLDGGHGHGAGDGATHVDTSHGHGGDGDAPTGKAVAKTGHAGPSFLNLSTLMAFLTWFGGAGYILRVFYGAWGPVALGAGAGLGLLGASLVFLFLSRVLYASQRVLDRSDYELPGTLARVTSSIRQGGTGEIVYTKGDSRYVASARGLNGQAIARGADVVIMRYAQGIAYVQAWDELLTEHKASPANLSRSEDA